MTDKEKIYHFADSIYTFCNKQKNIISGELILLERKKELEPISLGQILDVMDEQNEMAMLHGKTQFMLELLNHLNSKMAELGFGTNN